MKIVKEFKDITEFQKWIKSIYNFLELRQDYPDTKYSLKFDFHLLNITVSEKR